MKNKIEDLRNHLFATLEALQDKDKPMEIERARAVADVSKVLIDSAKVEVEHLRALEALGVHVTTNGDGSIGSGFIPLAPGLGTPERPRLVGGKK